MGGQTKADVDPARDGLMPARRQASGSGGSARSRRSDEGALLAAMMRAAGLLVALTMLLCTGCLGSAWQDVEAHFTETAAAAAASGTSTSGAVPTTSGISGGDPIQTVTGPPEEVTGPAAEATSSGETMSEENTPPEIESFGFGFEFKPLDHVSEAGPALLHIAVSDDAIKVRLKLNGEPLAELGRDEFPYAHAVLSDKFNGEHIFEAVALDVEGLESEPETAELTVTVPPPGTEKCLFDVDKGDPLVVQSAATGLVYAHDAIVVVGERDTGGGPRLTVWKLDPDHCEVLPGWPKTIANWTLEVPENKMSRGTALALDADGNIVVAGFTLEGLEPRRYLAMLNQHGARLWEKEGSLGDEISGVTVGPKPKAVVIAVGWRRSSVDPIRTDASIWMYKLDGAAYPQDVIGAPFTPDEQPDDFNERSERLRAVVFPPGKELAVAIGEREYMGDDNLIYSRTFLVRIHPLTGREGTLWTSPGEFFAHDAALGLGICGEKLIAAGWRRDAPPGAEPAPMLRWFATDGTPTGFRSMPLSFTQLHGVACDGELKVVAAGVTDQGMSDAEVFATPGLEGPLTWYESGSAGDDEAAAVSCDSRGHCAWVGFRTKVGKRHAVVRVHHP